MGSHDARKCTLVNINNSVRCTNRRRHLILINLRRAGKTNSHKGRQPVLFHILYFHIYAQKIIGADVVQNSREKNTNKCNWACLPHYLIWETDAHLPLDLYLITAFAKHTHARDMPTIFNRRHSWSYISIFGSCFCAATRELYQFYCMATE
jgi:hypothetical protein